MRGIAYDENSGWLVATGRDGVVVLLGSGEPPTADVEFSGEINPGEILLATEKSIAVNAPGKRAIQSARGVLRSFGFSSTIQAVGELEPSLERIRNRLDELAKADSKK